MRSAILIAMVGLVVAGCGSKASQAGDGQAVPGPVPSPPTQAVAPVVGGQDEAALSVGTLLEARPVTGARVRVTGLCYGLAGFLAAGPAPFSRSDWQLGDGAVAVFVVGPLPTNCVQTATPPLVTVQAIVLRDSAAVRIGGPLLERIYLRIVRP